MEISSRADLFCKNIFLKILQNSQENICVRVSFLIKDKPEVWGLQLYLKIGSFTGAFLWILENFKKRFFIEYLR